jgi:hypothetical protein
MLYEMDENTSLSNQVVQPIAAKAALADLCVEPVEKAPKISPIMVVFTEEKMMLKA